MGNHLAHNRVGPVSLPFLPKWSATDHPSSDHLGVKLGHRRVRRSATRRRCKQSLMSQKVLQREIAYARGVSVEHLSSPTRTHQAEDGRAGGSQDGAKPDGQLDSAPRGKRKYRRHPKVPRIPIPMNIWRRERRVDL